MKIAETREKTEPVPDENTMQTDFLEYGKHTGTFLDAEHIAWSNGSVWKRKALVSDPEAVKLFKTYKYE